MRPYNMAGWKNNQEPRKLESDILFVGNPGCGKSTLLNCLLRSYGIQDDSRPFKSGVSLHSAFANETKTYTQNRMVFTEAPGLEDLQMRQKCAQAIAEALEPRRNIKVVFTVMLEAGRVRQVDAALIQAVARETNMNHSDYGIVFNKLSKGVRKIMLERGKETVSVLSMLTGNDTENTVTNALYLPRYDELDDADDAIIHIPELVEFIDHLPSIEIKGCQIDPILLSNSFEVYISISMSYSRRRLVHETKISKGHMDNGRTEEKTQQNEPNIEQERSSISHQSFLMQYFSTILDTVTHYALSITDVLVHRGNMNIILLVMLAVSRIHLVDTALIQAVLHGADINYGIDTFFNKWGSIAQAIITLKNGNEAFGKFPTLSRNENGEMTVSKPLFLTHCHDLDDAHSMQYSKALASNGIKGSRIDHKYKKVYTRGLAYYNSILKGWIGKGKTKWIEEYIEGSNNNTTWEPIQKIVSQHKITSEIENQPFFKSMVMQKEANRIFTEKSLPTHTAKRNNTILKHLPEDETQNRCCQTISRIPQAGWLGIPSSTKEWLWDLQFTGVVHLALF